MREKQDETIGDAAVAPNAQQADSGTEAEPARTEMAALEEPEVEQPEVEQPEVEPARTEMAAPEEPEAEQPEVEPAQIEPAATEEPEAEPAVTGPVQLRLRRAPRYRQFGLTGAVIGVVGGVVLALSFTAAANYSMQTIVGYFAAIFGLSGAVVGLGVAVLIERRHTARGRASGSTGSRSGRSADDRSGTARS